eukprot:CAMPEP_0172545602 /NCGR_PEP_ID=MMETSP1067-20121228/15494_1 /TAXON_ID=265564 ORGANISM="Thalassiosira punctigera, Strain Tpunct2005C2" /NCGR_SAMPLE_ID=MMETSP1067 /ASSEMBLY_ACC=CAM_ASM_000444 /LENGTH=73 /DNA_ID=CAMNT_0013332375 /DNA_START=39 /DNA_END=257 /DNA_ORIENTATION=+
MTENERYISKLQDDLSSTRASNLEALQKTRSKYSDEINALTNKLQSQKECMRGLEKRNNELEEKLRSEERAYS